jgi:hypothetical protein
MNADVSFRVTDRTVRGEASMCRTFMDTKVSGTDRESMDGNP